MPTVFRVLTVLLIVFVCRNGQAQTSTSSPYSIYGLGDLESKGFTQNMAMGDLRYGLIQWNFLNVSNPSSYVSISKPTFEIGIASNFITLHADTIKQSTSNSYMRNIAFAFPVIKRKNRWGISFGLIPFSKMGYRIEDHDSVPNFGDVDFVYEGEGVISQVYFGNAITVLNTMSDTSGAHIGAGVNANYTFGSLNKTRRVIPMATNSFNIRTVNTTTVGDYNFDFGVFYRQKLSKKFIFSLGASYSLADSVKAKNIILTESYTGQTGFETIKDTVTLDTIDGQLYVPQSFGFGLAAYIGGNWIIGVDYSKQAWSDFFHFGQNGELANRDQVSVGLQWTPDYTAVTKFLKTARYRIGFRYTNTHLKLQNEQLSEYGIGFGAGFPLVKSQSPGTSLNFGFEIGGRGKDEPGFIKERFVNATIGFTFTPHKFDRWFYKRKIE